MIILDIDKPERCGKCPMHHDGNDYCKLAHDHASFVRAEGCPIQTIKTGHWIEKYHELFNRYYCDKCGVGSELRTNYCPNCGAKMVESQESEDKG